MSRMIVPPSEERFMGSDSLEPRLQRSEMMPYGSQVPGPEDIRALAEIVTALKDLHVPKIVWDQIGEVVGVYCNQFKRPEA